MTLMSFLTSGRSMDAMYIEVQETHDIFTQMCIGSMMKI
jgi:hypothetical protein